MNKNKIAIFSILIIAVIAVGVFWAIPNFKSMPGQSSKLRVVASANFWGNIATQIGGDTVEVSSIISKPGADPHLYESSARDAAALARADIVVSNGLGYDDFMGHLLSVSSGAQRQLIVASDVMNVAPGSNPHLWYDIPRVSRVADAIAKALSAKNPKYAKTYEANLISFKKSLAPLQAVLQQVKNQFSGTAVAYTERVPEYLLTAAGLKNVSPTGFSRAIEEGNDPSPADTITMNTLLTSRKAKVLLYNAQATSQVTERARTLAKRSGIPVVGVTETLPENEASYQSWQLHQAQALLNALKTK